MKKMVLFGAGLLMCIIGGVPETAITTFSKQMVHNSLVPTICTVMGFSYVMKLTECDRHLVSSISGVLKKSKIFLIPLAFLLTWWINIAIPSAAGCAAAVVQSPRAFYYSNPVCFFIMAMTLPGREKQLMNPVASLWS